MAGDLHNRLAGVRVDEVVHLHLGCRVLTDLDVGESPAGIASGIFALDVAGARQYAQAGIKLVSIAADVMWLLKATRQALQEARA